MIRLHQRTILIADYTCVLAAVGDQVRRLRERLSANLTLVGLFTCERNENL